MEWQISPFQYEAKTRLSLWFFFCQFQSVLCMKKKQRKIHKQKNNKEYLLGQVLYLHACTFCKWSELTAFRSILVYCNFPFSSFYLSFLFWSFVFSFCVSFIYLFPDINRFRVLINSCSLWYLRAPIPGFAPLIS